MVEEKAGTMAGMRALVVEDSMPVRMMLQAQLTGWGAEVEGVGTAAEARARLRAASIGGAPYDLLLLDHDLPDEPSMALAQVGGAAAVLLLASTSLVENDLALKGIAAQVGKPVRVAALFRAIQSITDGSVHEVATQAFPSFGISARVLVAADNEVDQLVALRLLEGMGYSVDTVSDGPEVVSAVRDGVYALVLMDCHLPGLDGYAATRAIRQAEENTGRRTPIVAMTADALSGDAERCLAAGMDDYLAKPVTSERLAATVARWATGPGAPLDAKALSTLRALERSGRPGLVEEIARIFWRDTPPRLAALREAASRGDAPAMAQTAHSLKGSAAQLGALRLAALSGAIETAGRAGEPSRASGLLDALEREATLVDSALNALLRESGDVAR